MNFNRFSDKDIKELVISNLFDLNLKETCGFFVNNFDDVVIKNFDKTTLNDIELEKVIFNSLKEALKDLYLKHGCEEELKDIDKFTDEEIEGFICSSFDLVDLKEVIKSMATYLNKNFDVKYGVIF